MKKYILLTTCPALFITLGLFAQKENISSAGLINGTANTKEQYYALHPKEDKSDIIDITGLGNISFGVYNQTGGTAGSMGYTHSENIVLSLITNVKGSNYQLVFYSDKENLAKIVNQEGDLTSVYFPMSMYNDIKQKLDQAISQKKKAQLKLVQKTIGYIGASLLF